MVKFEKLQWDSKHFGYPMARVSFAFNEKPKSLERQLLTGPCQFVMAREPLHEQERIDILENAGFRLAGVDPSH